MTGMDRETMQKSISVKTLPDSQKNMVVLGFVLLGVVSLFLYLGALLHLFAANAGVQAQGDSLFPAVVLVAVAAPLLCWAIDLNQRALFGRWQLGLELLVLNGALTFAGLWLVSRPAPVAVNARAATR